MCLLKIAKSSSTVWQIPPTPDNSAEWRSSESHLLRTARLPPGCLWHWWIWKQSLRELPPPHPGDVHSKCNTWLPLLCLPANFGNPWDLCSHSVPLYLCLVSAQGDWRWLSPSSGFHLAATAWHVSPSPLPAGPHSKLASEITRHKKFWEDILTWWFLAVSSLFCIAAAVGMGSCGSKHWECCNSSPQLVCTYISVAGAWGSEKRMTPAIKRKPDTYP